MITLVIMDGFGYRKSKKGNAIKMQGTPYLDKLKKLYPSTLIEASGNFVGLPCGVMGNSEAGHLTIGAGRRFYQPLERINKAIQNGDFEKNEQLLGAINHVKQTKGALHVLGLVSDGGVHSHILHIVEILRLAKKQNASKVFVHVVLDGRDTGIHDGVGFVEGLQKVCAETGAEIKTICGRAWAMDREKFYDRTEKAYKVLVLGESGNVCSDPCMAIQKSYEAGITDEFFEPTLIGDYSGINDGDAFVMCNIRKDRARQILEALTDDGFDKFSTKKLKNVFVVGLVEYDEDLINVKVAFTEEKLENSLAEVLSKNKKNQIHISETAKFPHVTYYFDCGQEKPFPFEEHKLLKGYDDINYDQNPQMRAFEIADEAMQAIATGKYDFVLVNFPNCDMIGHTGNFEATKTAVRVVDKCAYAVAMATLMVGGECIITADHGNAEDMLDGKLPKTTHTTNEVPLILVSQTPRKLLKGGELANIAPTILEMMGLEIPKEMSGSLLAENPTKKTKNKKKAEAKLARTKK